MLFLWEEAQRSGHTRRSAATANMYVFWLHTFWLLLIVPVDCSENISVAEGSPFSFTVSLGKVHGQVHVRIHFPDRSYMVMSSNGELVTKKLGESYKHRTHPGLTTENFSLIVDDVRLSDSGRYSFHFWHGAQVMNQLLNKTVFLSVLPKEPQSTDAGSSKEQQRKEEKPGRGLVLRIIVVMVPFVLVILMSGIIGVRIFAQKLGERNGKKRCWHKTSTPAGSSSEERAQFV